MRSFEDNMALGKQIQKLLDPVLLSRGIKKIDRSPEQTKLDTIYKVDALYVFDDYRELRIQEHGHIIVPRYLTSVLRAHKHNQQRTR